MAWFAALPVLAQVGMGAAAAGGITSAVGSYVQGQQQADAAKMNADIARREGQIAIEEARRQEQVDREKSARLMSRQRNLYGSSGAMMTGSPLEVMADQAYQAEMDALNIRYQGALRKWKSDSEAENYDWMAGNYSRAGTMGALTRLASTAGDTFLTAYGAKKPVSPDGEYRPNWFMGGLT